MIDVKKIESYISEIPDPEIPVITIKELGILRDVKLAEDTVVVTITPTYNGCPAMQMIEEQIKEILHSKGIEKVKVQLTYSPAWTTDWMTEEAKEKLKKYGIAPPTHSSCVKNFGELKIACPRCKSLNTVLISQFGSTACKALYQCKDCKEPFDHFKCH
jgi:ring-1,2-phenylacetyl-CoA epoxidase subunit PaaD